MTQSPFDQLAKSYLEEFLKPIGTVERQYEVPGESKYVDVWFIPDRDRKESIDDLGLLGEMAKTPCLIEPYHRSGSIIRLLASWGVKIETGEIESFLGQEIIMAFSQAFLDWEEATEAKGIAIGEQRGKQEQARSLVIRLLGRRIGILPTEMRSQVEQLSVDQLDTLGEALLDFKELADLTDWLDNLPSVFDQPQE